MEHAPPPRNVVGIAGSLRAESLNRALLHAAAELAPASLRIEVLSLDGIPLYDADLDTDEHRPTAVEALKRSIGAADAVLIATPEYNYGVPGVLKNAIDWASRPGHRSVFVRKPVAIMGASRSGVGTARAQDELKGALLAMLAAVLPHPEVLVARAHERFEAGRLTHEQTRTVVREMLEAFADWIARLAD